MSHNAWAFNELHFMSLFFLWAIKGYMKGSKLGDCRTMCLARVTYNLPSSFPREGQLRSAAMEYSV